MQATSQHRVMRGPSRAPFRNVAAKHPGGFHWKSLPGPLQPSPASCREDVQSPMDPSEGFTEHLPHSQHQRPECCVAGGVHSGMDCSPGVTIMHRTSGWRDSSARDRLFHHPAHKHMCRHLHAVANSSVSGSVSACAVSVLYSNGIPTQQPHTGHLPGLRTCQWRTPVRRRRREKLPPSLSRCLRCRRRVWCGGAAGGPPCPAGAGEASLHLRTPRRRLLQAMRQGPALPCGRWPAHGDTGEPASQPASSWAGGA